VGKAEKKKPLDKRDKKTNEKGGGGGVRIIHRGSSEGDIENWNRNHRLRKERVC